MKKYLVLAGMLVVLLLLVTATAFATPSMPVSGRLYYLPGELSARSADGIIFLDFPAMLWWRELEGETGFYGEAWGEGSQINFKDGTGYARGEFVFSGSLLDKSGGFDFQYLVWGAKPEYTGTWVIKHGTGDLSGMKAAGTLSGPGCAYWPAPCYLDYEGTVHFEP